MKTHTFLIIVTLGLGASAAPFKNLSFDQPGYPPDVPNPIPSISFSHDVGEWVRPGWQSSPQSAVGFNYTQQFEGWSSLLDVNYRNTTQPANSVKVPVVGSFSLGVWPASDGSPFFLAQTGEVPADARSLRFLYYGDNLRVSVDGLERMIHFTESGPSGDPEIGDLRYYAVDVSAFAGQSVELKFDFRSFGNYPGQDGGPLPGRPDAKFHVLDDLSFSPLPAVPEPATWALLGVGLMALRWWSRGRGV